MQSVVAQIESVKAIFDAIGSGMRLVMPADGKQPRLVDGFAKLGTYGRNDISVSRTVAEQAIKTNQLYRMQQHGDFVEGKCVRGGWGEFYSGPPADIYCMVM